MRFHRIMDGFYRGSRPRQYEHFYVLHSLGVRTIISLEEGWAEWIRPTKEREEWEAMDGRWISLPCSNWWPPVFQTVRFLTLAKIARTDGNVFFHCYSGVDRTGWMAAILACLNNPDISWKEHWRDEAILQGQHWWFRWWKPFFKWTLNRVPNNLRNYYNGKVY